MNTPLYPPEDYIVQECQCDDVGEMPGVRFVLDSTGALVIVDDDQLMYIAPPEVLRLAELLSNLKVPQ